MPSMTKKVNVVTRTAVRNITPPISGSYKNIIMSTSDILKLLCKRALVEEILPDGSTVRLTMKNYYLDNGAGLDAYADTDLEKKYNRGFESKSKRGPIISMAPDKDKKDSSDDAIKETKWKFKMDQPIQTLIPDDPPKTGIIDPPVPVREKENVKEKDEVDSTGIRKEFVKNSLHDEYNKKKNK